MLWEGNLTRELHKWEIVRNSKFQVQDMFRVQPDSTATNSYQIRKCFSELTVFWRIPKMKIVTSQAQLIRTQLIQSST